MRTLVHWLVGMCLAFGVAYAQVSSGTPELPPRHAYDHINNAASDARTSKAPQAAQRLTDEILDRMSLTKIPRDHSLRKRISSAIYRFETGSHGAIAEEDLANAMNGLAKSIGAPDWTHTNVEQLSIFRATLKPLVPQLIGITRTARPGGSPLAMSERLSPAEAVFVALALTRAKLEKPEFQIPPDEWTRTVRAAVAHRQQTTTGVPSLRGEPTLRLARPDHGKGDMYVNFLRDASLDEKSEVFVMMHKLLDRLGIAPTT